jgi:transposase
MDQMAVDGGCTLGVAMVDPEIVKQLRALAALGWGAKRIARELGIARNSVRRYLRGGEQAERQSRPKAWTLGEEERVKAVALLEGPAEGNAAVVKRLLAAEEVDVPLRTLQRVLAPHREAKQAAELATVRFETAPGHQLQIDFGEKWVSIAGARTKVYFFVAVLGYSRRIYVRASLSQRHDDWREGLAGAFRTFGGVTQRVLVDRARALIVGDDREAGTVRVHPAFAEFCKDWGTGVAACRPYRARTKGKTESGVGYVKRNAVAGLAFTSFEALEAHLSRWMLEADERIHGTTRERPSERFERDERAALQPLPSVKLQVRQRRVRRRVGAIALSCAPQGPTKPRSARCAGSPRSAHRDGLGTGPPARIDGCTRGNLCVCEESWPSRLLSRSRLRPQSPPPDAGLVTGPLTATRSATAADVTATSTKPASTATTASWRSRANRAVRPSSRGMPNA